tara:strand:+ start:678 stop:1052 length:375 start_codon:yes stop_codon:yes gene_type:complete
MSVTFSVQRPVEEDRCDFVPGSPSLHLGNGHARQFLTLIGIDSTNLIGAIEKDEIPEIMRRVTVVKNTPEVFGLVSDTTTEQREGGPRIVHCGTPLSTALHWLDRFHEMLRFAAETDDALIFWA